MIKDQRMKEAFTRNTGVKPEDDWAAYFAFVSAVLIADIHKSLYEKKDSNNHSIFDTPNSLFE